MRKSRALLVSLLVSLSLCACSVPLVSVTCLCKARGETKSAALYGVQTRGTASRPESDDAPGAALEPEARAFARAARAAASELAPGSASSESESAPASRCQRRCSSAASTACVCSGQHRLSRSCGSSRLTEGACSSSSNAWQ